MKKALAVEGLGSPARPDVKNRLLQRLVGSESRGQPFERRRNLVSVCFEFPPAPHLRVATGDVQGDVFSALDLDLLEVELQFFAAYWHQSAVVPYVLLGRFECANKPNVVFDV